VPLSRCPAGFSTPTPLANCRFDGDPENEYQNYQEGQKADDSDPGGELEGQQGEGDSDEQIGE
jgi:hypothetical protein